jgi:predicted lipid carrier protein YhbT
MVERFQGELPAAFRILTLPAAFLPLGRALTFAVRRFARRKPQLFDRLGEYGRLTFLIAPTDLDFAFLMVPDGARAEVRTLTRRAGVSADVTVKGPLLTLLGLLDGTYDGDALFFNRAISVSGRTDALVAFRNAIEDAELKPSDFVGLSGQIAAALDRSVFRGLDFARRRLSPAMGSEAR